MRLAATAITILVLAWGMQRADAQDFCPFTEFCAAQTGHCHYSCSALADAVPWQKREAWMNRCSTSCEVQYGRCIVRQSRHCAGR
jgi:hypothetical protein